MKKTAAGFSLIELMSVVAIIGILSAIAGPMYMKYIRKSRTSEAMSNLGTIALFEETYFSENDSYTSAVPNPATVPAGGSRLNFNSSLTGWDLLGRVIPNNTPLYFQYEVRAGQFIGSVASTGGTGNLVDYTSTKIPGGTDCETPLTAKSASNLGVPNLNNSNWFYITAVGDQKEGGVCSLFVKVVDRTDTYKENETD